MSEAPSVNTWSWLNMFCALSRLVGMNFVVLWVFGFIVQALCVAESAVYCEVIRRTHT